MKTRVFFLALSQGHARDIIHACHYNPVDCVIIDNVDQLQGLQSPVVVCCPAWGRRHDREPMRQMLCDRKAILVLPCTQDVMFSSDINPKTLQRG